MNGAGAALVGDAGAVFTNPASLATLRYIGIEGAYRALPAAGRVFNGALALRIRQFHLALGGALLDHGTDPANFPVPGLPPGTEFRERLGMGSVVYRFGIIALGGTLKYVRTNADTAEQKALSSDAGLTIAIFDILAFAFSIQNLGGNWRGESALEMPRLSRFGFTMNYVDPQESFRLLSTLELQWPEGRSSRFVLGVEGGVVLRGVGILGRGAYGSRPEGTEASKFTVGGSIAITRMSLDYAYQPNDARGERTHRFGLRLTL
ncbi:MAG: hypothetical protein JSW71_13455 [Gemmatimonadota bacterium]|nr:MAG: hypothetical protein JSW71_13455 [Gemmatimonadota bacterium]